MALINCPDCGREVSDQAAACPQCARPIYATKAPGKAGKDAECFGALMCIAGAAMFFLGWSNSALMIAGAVIGIAGLVVFIGGRLA